MTRKEPLKAISLKGQGKGIRFIISSKPPLESVLKEAKDMLDGASSMIKNTEITMVTGARPLDGEIVVKLLENIIWPYSLRVSFWETEDSVSRKFLARSGFSVADGTVFSPKPMTQVLVVDRSLRSGQKVSHAGDVLILGDVHDGAEVTATGNICVFGILSGVVHAGSNGDTDRFIAVDSFRASQIRIGNKVSSDIDPSEHRWWGRPVIVSLERGSFQVTERK